jgi:hypothetical protein
VGLTALTDAPASDEAGGVPTLSYVLGGVALGGLGAGIALGVYGAGEYDDAKKRCAPGCGQADVAAGKRAYVIADVAFGISVASAAAAVIVYFVSQPSEHTQAAPVVDLAVLRGGAAVRWTSVY